MAISWTAKGAAAAASPSSPWTQTAAALGTGDIYLFMYGAGFAGITGDLSVTINGGAASIVGSPVTINGIDAAMVWTAAGNVGATGNIVVSTTGAFQDIAINWLVITGENPPTLTTSTAAFSQADPQGPVTGTVLAGGVGIISYFPYIISGTPLPITWAGATTAGSVTEAYSAGGNQIAASMASTTTSSASVTAAGSTNSTDFSVNALLMLAFPAASGGAPATLASIAIPRKMFLKPKSKFYLR